MLEKTYPFSNGNEKKIEKIIDDQAVMINHMIFTNGKTAIPDWLRPTVLISRKPKKLSFGHKKNMRFLLMP